MLQAGCSVLALVCGGRAVPPKLCNDRFSQRGWEADSCASRPGQLYTLFSCMLPPRMPVQPLVELHIFEGAQSVVDALRAHDCGKGLLEC